MVYGVLISQHIFNIEWKGGLAQALIKNNGNVIILTAFHYTLGGGGGGALNCIYMTII